MMTGFQAEENLTGRAPKKCAKNSGRYPAVAIADVADFGQKYAAVVFIGPETLRIAKGVMNHLSVREVVMEDFLVDLDDRGFLLLGGFVSRHGMALLSEVCLVTKL